MWFPGTNSGGALGGLDAIPLHLEFDDNFWVSKKSVVAVIPASHPAALSFLVRDLLGGVICHYFFAFFSLHTSTPICFLVSREVSRGGKRQQSKALQERISFYDTEIEVLLNHQVGLFDEETDFCWKRIQIPCWGFTRCKKALQIGRANRKVSFLWWVLWSQQWWHLGRGGG